jgi:hypothetical protein
MKLVPDNPSCEICGRPATVELRDSSTNKDHLYCPSHKPDLWPGKKNPDLVIRRHRTAPNSPTSRMMAAAEDTAEHQFFRTEMCDLKILGGDGAIRYYLSKLTGSDQFALCGDEFVDNVREYVVAKTDGAAACLAFDSNTVGFMAPFFKYEFELSKSNVEPKMSKQDRAVMLFLHHPLWSDEKIAKEVPTTIKQLKRYSNYNVLRAAVARNSAM